MGFARRSPVAPVTSLTNASPASSAHGIGSVVLGLKLMSASNPLSAAEQAWLVKDEQRWARAHRIAAKNPGVHVDGVYRVLRDLEKTPSEGLKAALAHGRLFSAQRR